MLGEVCKDVKIEPKSIELTGEELNQQAIKSDESCISGFWSAAQKVFCAVWVFDHNALRCSGTETKKCFKRNEVEKKKSYNQRVMQEENATTLFWFSLPMVAWVENGQILQQARWNVNK